MNRTLLKHLFALISTALFAAPAFGAQIPVQNVTAQGTYHNDLSKMIDGVVPAERTVWNANTNVWWQIWCNSPVSFTFDLGDLFNVEDVLLSVDNNDSYRVTWSADGSTWNNLLLITSAMGEISSWEGGMDTFSTDSTNGEYVAGIDFAAVTARYFRINSPCGDCYRSIGEFQVFGSPVVPAVPLPAAAWLFFTGLMGLFGLRRLKAGDA